MTDFFGAMGTAIYGKLSGGTALTTALGGTTIYSEQAPDGASLPYVVFSHQGGGPENITHGGLRNDIWFVRAYAASRAQANALDGLMEDLLSGKTLTVTGFTNFCTFREQDLQMVENPPSGARVYMAGAMYRVRLT